MTPSTKKIPVREAGLSPEIVKELEMAISQRLDPRKAMLKGLQNLRAYAIREGLMDDMAEDQHDKPVKL